MKPWNRIGHQELLVRKTGCGYLRNICIYMEKRIWVKRTTKCRLRRIAQFHCM